MTIKCPFCGQFGEEKTVCSFCGGSIGEVSSSEVATPQTKPDALEEIIVGPQNPPLSDEQRKKIFDLCPEELGDTKQSGGKDDTSGKKK